MSKIAKFGGEMLKSLRNMASQSLSGFCIYRFVLDCMIAYCHNCFTCGNKLSKRQTFEIGKFISTVGKSILNLIKL